LLALQIAFVSLILCWIRLINIRSICTFTINHMRIEVNVVLFPFFIYDTVIDILVHSLVHLEYTLKNMEPNNRGVVVAKEAKRAYITDQDTVVVTNARTKEVIRDSSQRKSLSLSEKNRSYMITGTVVRSIDTSTGKVIKRIPVGTEEKPPSSILAIPGDKTQLYVVNRADRKIFVIDTDMDEVIDTIPVEASGPSRIANAVEAKETMEDSKFSKRVAHVQEPDIVGYSHTVSSKEATVLEEKAKDLESWPLLGGKEVAKHKVEVAWTTAVSFVIASKMKVAIAAAVLLVVAVVVTVIAVAVVPKPIPLPPPQCKVSIAYVVNQGSNTISVINTSTNLVSATIPVGANPNAVAVTRDGARAYVTNTDSNTVSVIDTVANLVLTNIQVNRPYGVAINSDGTWVYVTNYSSDSGSFISVIATVTNQVIFAIPLSAALIAIPREIVVTPNGARAYVIYDTGTGYNRISVVDTVNKLELREAILVGPRTRNIAIAPNGIQVYVACNNGTYVIDTVANQVKAVIPVPGGSTDSNAVTVSPDGQRAYVVNYGSGNGYTTTIINTINNLVLANIRVGAVNTPSYMVKVAVSLDGTWVYIVIQNTNSVFVIDSATNEVMRYTIPVGSNPLAITTAWIPC
jgi:YVTN family beta-propeller protein